MNTAGEFEAVPCPICGNTRLRLLFKKGQFRLPCHVSICPSDGLVFLSPRWSKERYMYYYQNEYDYHYRPDVLKSETEDQKYQNIKNIFSRLERSDLIKSKNSILDVGAGMGWSLEWINKNHTQFRRLAAIESSKYCIKNLQGIAGVELISNDIDADWESAAFDIVIMRHVLEHVMNPIDTLKKVRGSLMPNGIVYIAVPDMMDPFGSLKKYWFRTVHTFYFSQKTLESIASMANLQLIEINSEKSELWAVFKKAQSPIQKHIQFSVYEKQIKVIKEHQKKDRLMKLKMHKGVQIFWALLPNKIKSWIKARILIHKSKVSHTNRSEANE